MAVKFVEGFEGHTNSGQLARRYATFSGSFSTQTGRTFGNAASPASAQATSKSLGNADTWILGFGLKMTGHNSQIDDNNNGLYLEDGAAEQFHVGFLSTSGVGFRVKLFRGGTELATTGDFAFNVWHYFELKVTINNTTGSYELRRNGVVEFSDTNANTAANGNTGADVFAWRFGNNIAQAHFDDLYLCDDQGGVNDDFLGPQIVEAIEVIGNGATSDWINDQSGVSDANNYTQVDDAGNLAPDDVGAGGTVSSDTNAQRQLFQMGDLVNVNGNVTAVVVEAQLAMASAGTRTVKVKINTDDAPNDNFISNQTTFDKFSIMMNINPTNTNA